MLKFTLIPQDSVSVENAIYLDDRISEVAAVGVPDERLGELVVAIVSVKSAFRGMVKESEIIEQCQRRCVSVHPEYS